MNKQYLVEVCVQEMKELVADKWIFDEQVTTDRKTAEALVSYFLELRKEQLPRDFFDNQPTESEEGE